MERARQPRRRHGSRHDGREPRPGDGKARDRDPLRRTTVDRARSRAPRSFRLAPRTHPKALLGPERVVLHAHRSLTGDSLWLLRKAAGAMPTVALNWRVNALWSQ